MKSFDKFSTSVNYLSFSAAVAAVEEINQKSMFLRADQLKGKTNIINPINNPSFDSLSNPNCIKFSFEKFSFNTQNIIFFDNDKIEDCIAPLLRLCRNNMLHNFTNDNNMIITFIFPRILRQMSLLVSN